MAQFHCPIFALAPSAPHLREGAIGKTWSHDVGTEKPILGDERGSEWPIQQSVDEEELSSVLVWWTYFSQLLHSCGYVRLHLGALWQSLQVAIMRVMCPRTKLEQRHLFWGSHMKSAILLLPGVSQLPAAKYPAISTFVPGRPAQTARWDHTA